MAIEACVARHHDLAHIHLHRISKTWRSPLEKAGEEADHEWLLRIADSMIEPVRRAFRDLVERIRGSADEAELRRALESGDTGRVLEALGLGEDFNAQLGQAIVPPLEDAFREAGREAPEHIPPKLIGAELGYRFNIVNPHAVDFLQRYDMGLIRQVSTETRDAVRDIVLAAFRQGGHPVRDQAKQIREIVGLTRRQAQAVVNYRAVLEGEDRAADQIDRMTEKYRQKLLRLRAENIARTETIRASNAGQDAAWNQAADQGLLNRDTVRRKWLVTPDDRLCIYCAEVPIMNLGGVRLGEMFQTPLGPALYPPLHPQCRCVAVLGAL